MDPETVIDPTVDPSGGEPESPKPGPDKAKEQPIDPKEFRAMQTRMGEMQKQLEETRESERYWADRARGAAPAEPDDDEPDPDDDELVVDDKPEQLVDDLSSRGMDALVKRGVLTKKEARELIAKEVAKQSRKIAEEVVGRERTKFTTDSEIVTKYPELKDPESALFKKTREIYKGVVQRNPAKGNDPEALLDAAERAKLQLEIETLKAGRGDRDDDDGDPAERNRRERIRAQSSDRGRRSSDFEEDDNRLGPEARELIQKMDITEDEFLESRRKLSGGRRSR